MENNRIHFTSAELSNLWTSYIANSMSICVLQYFANQVDDHDVSEILDFALDLAQHQCQGIRDLFTLENIPVPIGFTEEDVDVNAPRLFSDMYVLQYLKQMANMGMGMYSPALYVSVRDDVRDFYHSCLLSSSELDQKTTKALLEKGVYLRAPLVCPPESVRFVKNQGFLAGWFGDQRPLTVVEMTNLYINILLNSLGKALIMGFRQVAKSKELRKYFIRGKHIAMKHYTTLGSYLQKEDISVPSTWDSQVTDSTISPFSDKLLLFHITSLISFGIGNYGLSVSTSPRRDIAAQYTKLLSDILLYAEDGANLMIKNGWMEEPPMATDREAIVKK